MVKNPPAKAGVVGLIPGSGRSSGEGNGNPLQYSCLENQSHGQRSLGGYGSEDQRVGHNLSRLNTHPLQISCSSSLQIVLREVIILEELGTVKDFTNNVLHLTCPEIDLETK